jgi:hypothetical protein
MKSWRARSPGFVQDEKKHKLWNYTVSKVLSAQAVVGYVRPAMHLVQPDHKIKLGGFVMILEVTKKSN